MTENHNFEFPDDFEERVKQVHELLDDPSYVEYLNQTFIVNCTVDGQRLYKVEEIQMAARSMVEAKEENFIFEPDNICLKVGKGLSATTDNFTKVGSFRMSGKIVSDFADSFFYASEKNMWISGGLGIAVESIVAGALGIGFGISFESYQTDITIRGQGLIDDTYFMDIHFRPTPKNVI